MKNKLKLLVIYPIFVLVFTLFVNFLQLLATEFTPRMYFYSTTPVVIDSQENKQTYQFFSEENYLGIVSLVFYENTITPATEVLFRIKKEGDDQWIIENKYNVVDLNNIERYPFGFPVQDNSKEHNYIFELEGVCPSSEGCAYNPSIHNIIVRHYYPKSYFINTPFQALSFMGKKVYQNFLHHSLKMEIVTLTLPLILYFIGLLIFSHRSHATSRVNSLKATFNSSFNKIDLVLFLILGVDIVAQITLLFYVTLVLVISAVVILKRKVLFTFTIFSSLFCYVLSLLLLFINIKSFAERASLWSFVFFSISIVYLAYVQLRKDS